MKYSMTCTCGDVMAVDAENKDAAVAMLKANMTEDALKQHFAEKHAGQPMPSVEQAHAGIEQSVQEVAA